MILEQRFFNRKEKRKLKSVKAIVVHWDGTKGIPNVDYLWDWIDKKSENSYHFLVSGQKIINTRSKDLRAIHCGHRTYRKKAKQYFGNQICSKNNSPNNYTIGVCMLHDLESGGYHSDTMEAAIELLASLCNEYELDPHINLLRHSDITNEKEPKCPKAFFEDDDDPDDLWKSLKGWVAIEKDQMYSKSRMHEMRFKEARLRDE